MIAVDIVLAAMALTIAEGQEMYQQHHGDPKPPAAAKVAANALARGATRYAARHAADPTVRQAARETLRAADDDGDAS